MLDGRSCSRSLPVLRVAPSEASSASGQGASHRSPRAGPQNRVPRRMMKRMFYEAGRAMREAGTALDRVGLDVMAKPIFKEPCEPSKPPLPVLAGTRAHDEWDTKGGPRTLWAESSPRARQRDAANGCGEPRCQHRASAAWEAQPAGQSPPAPPAPYSGLRCWARTALRRGAGAVSRSPTGRSAALASAASSALFPPNASLTPRCGWPPCRGRAPAGYSGACSPSGRAGCRALGTRSGFGRPARPLPSAPACRLSLATTFTPSHARCLPPPQSPGTARS